MNGWIDGRMDGRTMGGEKLEVAFFLVEELLYGRKGRPSKTQGET